MTEAFQRIPEPREVLSNRQVPTIRGQLHGMGASARLVLLTESPVDAAARERLLTEFAKAPDLEIAHHNLGITYSRMFKPGVDTPENKALGERIEAALALLSPDQREVFYLRHYSGLSFREIAELQSLPIGTVLARMSRAAAQLRKILEESGH